MSPLHISTPFSLRSNLILSSHEGRVIRSCFCPSDFHTKTLHALYFLTIRATRPAHLVHLYIITRIVLLMTINTVYIKHNRVTHNMSPKQCAMSSTNHAGPNQKNFFSRPFFVLLRLITQQEIPCLGKCRFLFVTADGARSQCLKRFMLTCSCIVRCS
jgi:hypothetical protein